MVRRSLRINGKYKVDGSTYSILIGNRAQVGHGTAYKTSGGLTKKNLIQNKWGRWVSKSKSITARKDKRLKGFFAKKGAFGAVQK
jgi:hypothetical protein